jgi:hypothetical protein
VPNRDVLYRLGAALARSLAVSDLMFTGGSSFSFAHLCYRLESDALVPGPHQLDEGFTRGHDRP